MRFREAFAAGLGALIVAGTGAPLEPAPPATPVARITFLEGQVERTDGGGDWKQMKEGDRMMLGDRLRTGPEALARLEWPWMAMTVGPASTVSIPRATILSTVLERGRLEVVSEGEIGDIIKIKSSEAEVRGQGRAVVRREEASTRVTALGGDFRVAGKGKSVTLTEGKGSVVGAKSAPSPAVALPATPRVVSPGADPSYVKQGDPVSLSWISETSRNHLQVLALDSEVVVMEKDVGGSPHSLRVPWLGMFRWRVSARGDRGLESPPSTEGLFCVVEK